MASTDKSAPAALSPTVVKVSPGKGATLDEHQPQMAVTAPVMVAVLTGKGPTIDEKQPKGSVAQYAKYPISTQKNKFTGGAY
jgi:hypothetical protein